MESGLGRLRRTIRGRETTAQKMKQMTVHELKKMPGLPAAKPGCFCFVAGGRAAWWGSINRSRRHQQKQGAHAVHMAGTQHAANCQQQRCSCHFKFGFGLGVTATSPIAQRNKCQVWTAEAGTARTTAQCSKLLPPGTSCGGLEWQVPQQGSPGHMLPNCHASLLSSCRSGGQHAV